MAIDRTRTEPMAASVEAQLNSFVRGFPGAVVMFDRNMNYIAVSPRWQRDYGLGERDLVGLNHYELFPDLPEHWRNIHRRALAGESFACDEELWVRADGSRVWVRWAISPWLDAGQRIGGITLMSENISARKETEADLRVSDQALKSISQGVLITNAQRLILSANDAFLAITGYSRSEVIGRNCRFLQGPQTDLRTVEAIRAALRGAGTFAGEILNYRKDGTPFWNDLVISPVRDELGNLTHFIGITRDITERKKSALALAEREAELERTFLTSRIGMTIATLDGRWLRVNPCFCAIVGWSESELVALGFEKVTHPEDLVPNLQLQRELIAGLRESYQMEKRYVCKDGRHVWAHLSVSLMKDAHGAPLRMIAQIQDITEKKRAEEARLLGEARLAQAFEASPIGFAHVTLDGRYLKVNRRFCSMLGRSEAELLATQTSETSHPDDYQYGLPFVTALIAGKYEAIQLDKRYRHKDGHYIWAQLNAFVVRDAEGTPLYCVGQVQDISERIRATAEREQLLDAERAARSEAERANRMKNEFLSTLSHELRTPLNAILGWSELLKRCGKDPKTLQEGLDIISRNTRTQTMLIEDLLDMSRIESGVIRLDLQRVELGEVIAAAANSVRPEAEAKGVELLIETEVEAMVKGDPDRLQQVVWNLLSNSVKFTPAQGQVVVRLKCGEAHAEISVSDNGQGIQPEFLPHVFDRFRQEDATTTRRKGGLGIGLSLVKQLVALHGGGVVAESSGSGLGSTFTISLPLLADGSMPERLEFSENPEGASPCLAGMRVLAIDDEFENRVLLARIIEAEGGEVLIAGSALEGFELFKAQQPDVIVCDIGMPLHDGYEFLKWVRALDAESGGLTPALAFTAFARAEDRERARLAGFQSHLVKPANPSHLTAEIARLVKGAC